MRWATTVKMQCMAIEEIHRYFLDDSDAVALKITCCAVYSNDKTYADSLRE